MYVSMYVFVQCALVSAHGGLKMSWNPLELELQAAVSCHGGAGNGTQVFLNSRKCFCLPEQHL